MPTNERVQVALFIDWDNLAISTAADLGGAIPDVKAIVQRAQQSGTVVIAKAYAEWQATSDRLAIYRAGVEPVYAPTFRFEPDTATQPGRGKSLADPCMVADCVDALHLFPDVNVYVLVTGDKDMIPVVRLAQLRGRRVVVIGPDYVAAVLREMADEFVPYRSLVEGAPPRPPEPGRRYSGGRHPSFARQEKAVPAVPAVTVAPPAAPLVAPRPRPAEIKPVVEPEQPPAPAPAIEEQVLAPAEDLRTVFSTVQEILRQRLDEGRERIRATNLKDSLMQRMPGFSERKLGFTKFKDLLKSAEKAGLIHVIAAGPVHWISLPNLPQPTPVAPPEPAPAEAPVDEFAQLEAQRNGMIRFIHELRERSRWLTYTYVLTNLISYYARTLPQTEAENQARAMLNYLVQQGVLQVDKEPQEVEVGGARHRVRMCHLNTEHELVTEVLGFHPEEAEEAIETVAIEGTEASEESVEAQQAQPERALVAEVTEPPNAAESLGVDESVLGGNGSLAPGAGESAVESSAVIAEAGEPDTFETIRPDVFEAEPQGTWPFEAAEPAAAIAEPMPAAHEPVAEALVPAETAAEPVETAAEPAGGAMEPTEAAVEPAAAEPVEAPAEPAPIVTETPARGPRDKLENAYRALREVLESDTSAERPMVSASNLRMRLVQVLRSFNERELGFSRFKDFLLSAEEAGIVRTKMRGHVTLVGPAAPKPV